MEKRLAALFLCCLAGCATVARRPAAEPPAAARDLAARAADLLELAGRAAKGLTPPLPMNKAVILSGWAFSLLLGAEPSNGFAPIAGTSCPCWRDRPFPVADGGSGESWILDRGKEWIPASREEEDAFAGRPGALVAVVIHISRWSASSRFQLLEAFFMKAMHGEYVANWPDASRQLSVGHPEALRRGTWLLEEQLLLARALRAKPGSVERSRALFEWSSVRAYLEREHLLPEDEGSAETYEGLSGFLALTTAKTRKPEDSEQDVARALEAGGLGLWPEGWFGYTRAMAVGAAEVLLLRDVQGGLGLLARSRPFDRGLRSTLLLARRPGAVRAFIRDPEEVRVDLELREPLPSFRPMPRVDYEMALASLRAQAKATVRVIYLEGYDWAVSLVRIRGSSQGAFCLGSLVGRAAGHSVRWTGLAANEVDKGGESAKWFEFFDFSGRRRSALPIPNLETERAGTLLPVSPHHWTLELPKVDATR